MTRIIFVEHDGTQHEVDAQDGVSLMQTALDASVPGIDGDCGGAAACGPCHCFIGDEWRKDFHEADPMEEAMLSMRPDRSDESRLGCQIDVKSDMDGMIVRLPEFQM